MPRRFEAASRPSMRFVPIKSKADQAMAAVHRAAGATAAAFCLWPRPVGRDRPLFTPGAGFGAQAKFFRRQELALAKAGVRLGAISTKGDVYLRRLLINGAQPVLNSKRAKTDLWIVRLLHTKPRLVVAVAAANKMARSAWAVMVRQTAYHPDFRRAAAAA